MPAKSRVAWFDLVASDPASVAETLAPHTGWRLEGGARGTFRHGARAVAGALPLSPTEEGPAPAPHWVPWITTADADQLVRRLTFLQGEVLEPAEAVEGLGTTTLLADPSGAVFLALQPDQDHGDPGTPPLGVAGFALLAAPRADLARKVYRTLLDWTEADVVETETGALGVLKARSLRAAGLLDLAGQPEADSEWFPCVVVEDAQAALARALSDGAVELLAPTELRRVGTLAAARLPSGLPIGWRSLA